MLSNFHCHAVSLAFISYHLIILVPPHPHKKNRYLVLANMLMESEVNPFDGQEAKP